MAPEVKTAKNSKLPKLPENSFEPVALLLEYIIISSMKTNKKLS
jgi:hypothetical protein